MLCLRHITVVVLGTTLGCAGDDSGAGGDGSSSNSTTTSTGSVTASITTGKPNACEPDTGCPGDFCLDGACVNECPADRPSCTFHIDQGIGSCCLPTEVCCSEAFWGAGYCEDAAIGCPEDCPPDGSGRFCVPPEHCVQDPETQIWGCQ